MEYPKIIIYHKKCIKNQDITREYKKIKKKKVTKYSKKSKKNQKNRKKMQNSKKK